MRSLFEIFESAMSWIDLSHFEKFVSVQEELDRCDAPDDLKKRVQKLLSFRIATLKGILPEEAIQPVAETPGDSWIAAENRFFRGIYFYHVGNFRDGVNAFLEAKIFFEKAGISGRAHLSSFNVYVGKCNLGLISSTEEEWLELLALERDISSSEASCQRVLAMIFRDKADILLNQGRPYAALSEVTRAIEIFRRTGPQSDFQLALLYASDLCLDLNRVEDARSYYEGVVPPMEIRIQFPMAYVEWRLTGKGFDLTQFEVLPPRWRDRYLKLLNPENGAVPGSPDGVLQWKLSRSVLIAVHPSSELKLKPKSLEGRLVRLLMQGKASKRLLCQSLWPELDSVQVVDNRLHVLVSRANQKLGNLIDFDGRFYSLKKNIEVA